MKAARARLRVNDVISETCQILYSASMKQDRIVRRNGIIVAVVLLVLLAWPTFSRMLRGTAENQRAEQLDVKTASLRIVGSWRSAMLSLTFDTDGLCRWNGGAPEPCGLYDAEHVPRSVEPHPVAGGVYLETGADTKRGYRVLLATSDSLHLLLLPNNGITVYSRNTQEQR